MSETVFDESVELKPKRKTKKRVEIIESIEVVEDNEVIDTSIEGEEIDPKRDIQSLLKLYNESQDDYSFISSDYTISAMDEVNNLIADALIKIDELSTNGKKESLFGKVSSSLVKTIDPKDSWIGKWVNNTKESIKRSEFEGKTPEEIVSIVKKIITDKRVEVQKLVSKLYREKESCLNKISYYEEISSKARTILNATEEDTEENFNAKLLVTMVEGNVIDLKNIVDTRINSLISIAKLTVERIGARLPSLTSKVQNNLDIQLSAQQVSDLNSITQIFADLSDTLDERATIGVQETVLQALDMVKGTGVGLDKLNAKIKRDEEYKKKLIAKVEEVKAEVNKELIGVQQISNRIANHNKSKTELFLESYSANKNTPEKE